MKAAQVEHRGKSNVVVKGARAMFENSIKRQRAPSPAPRSMTGRSQPPGKLADKSDSFSSYKEHFEQFTSPKPENVRHSKGPFRRAASEENVSKSAPAEDLLGKVRTRSNSVAEKRWIHAKTKVYEQLSEERSQTNTLDKSISKNQRKIFEDKTLNRKPGENKGEITSLQDRIKKYKSDVETKKTTAEKTAEWNDSAKGKVKDLKYNFTSPQLSRKEMKVSNSAFDKFKSLENSIIEDKSAPPKLPFPKTIDSYSCSVKDDAGRHTLPKPKKINKSIENDTPAKNSANRKLIPEKDSKTQQLSNGTSSKSINDKRKIMTLDVVDHDSALNFMVELVTAIDNEQHVPMKQLINLFEIMKKENGEMKASIDLLKAQLNEPELKTLSQSLENKLAASEQQLQEAKHQIKELLIYREALKESEERCEELEELNQQYLEEIEELKLIMNEMRDQFHDDEIHETIILQQRLDDMARSLRIIHFRLKKADAKLQETEREKETLLEEIKLLQGGTFTDDEIRRMQSLEGDLQAAKEISVELHNQLQRSEERREKLEAEAANHREEIKSLDLENDRLRNNILHLREQLNAGSGSPNLLPVATIVRQGSADIDTLKSNLEASIEREADAKEQLVFAEEEAKMLRKRLRDIEHENEALAKQLKKLSQVSAHRGDYRGESSEHIEAEVIQLENTQLRHDNDQLHKDMDTLKSQIKSLQQKLTLVQDEQNEGPLSVMKNSLYYETKFELMNQEIDDLRQQLQDKDADYKKLREDTSGTSKRDSLRRQITGESVSIPFDDVMKHQLEQLQYDNDQLLKENQRLKALDTVSADKSLVADTEKSQLVTELEYYRKSRPEIAKLVNGVYDSEQKILTYEDEIANLRQEMCKMENSLKGDINKLTMKNTILRSLLEAINEHEGETTNASDSSETNASNSNDATGSSVTPSSMEPAHYDVSNDNLVTQHMSRLPLDLQNQFKKKIEYLERQLREEKERAKAAEGLLQQVKMSANQKRPVFASKPKGID